MSKESAIEIIKGAMLLEHNGRAFYENVAKTTESTAVREVFSSMALEESKHLDILGSQYKSLKKDGRLSDIMLPEQDTDFTPDILTKKIRSEVTGAGYEAAAISAALSLEQKAIDYYSKRAGETDDKLEKELYDWLAEWEKTHLDLLVSLDQQLKEKVWYDTSFWPVI